MKILYFHQYFKTPTNTGGTRSYELAKKLIEKGHKVTIVCGDIAKLELVKTKNKTIKRGFIDDIEVIQINNITYSTKDSIGKRIKTFSKFAIKSIQIAMREDYDLLFATSTPLTAGLPGIIMKMFRKKKFVFEVRDLWPELPKALGLKNPFLIWGMSVLEWLSYHSADACIGLSPGICKGIERRSQKNKKIALIPNGSDLELFVPSSRDKLNLEGIKADDIVAIFTGAHGIANGLDAIINTAKVLKERNRNDIKLVFIGDGKTKSEIMKDAIINNLDNCHFYDPMPKNKLNQVVSSADIGMMVLANIPAFYYGTSPNKFFDYISSGLPVINNYPGWLADLINENKCGIVVEPDNPESFADGLIKLADDKELRKTYGENARILAEKEFDRNKLGSKFVEFIESVYQN